MTDDVGVNVLGEVETNRQAVRAGIGIVVRKQRNPRPVREAQRYRCGFAGYVRRTG
jgi:hypothetical protein